MRDNPLTKKLFCAIDYTRSGSMAPKKTAFKASTIEVKIGVNIALNMRELQNSIRAKIRARFAASDFSQIA